MDHQYIHPHGSQNQKNLQPCGCDCSYSLASQGIWAFQLSDEYTYLKIIIMNLKRIFGALLTLLGVGGLIYAAILYVNGSAGTNDVKALVIYGILGLVFFIAGINLVRTTKDES